MIVRLQKELIYEFAIKYKQISRVTYLTCREMAVNINTMGKDNKMKNKRNKRKDMNVRNTIDILKGIYNTKTTTVLSNKNNNNNKAMTNSIRPPMPTKAMSAASNVNGNGNGNANVTSSGSNSIADVAADGRFAEKSSSSDDITITTIPTTEATTNIIPRGILIKVVQIDQLINKQERNSIQKNKNQQNTNMKNYNRRYNNDYGDGGGSSKTSRRLAGTGDSRNSYRNANWLEHILPSDIRHQMVVLNLSCGPVSRRLLEMASQKALFNSAYHWLLIEDYAFNRQQNEIDENSNAVDDNDDGDDGDDADANDNNMKVVNNDDNSRQTIKKLKDNIVVADAVKLKSQDNGANVIGNRQWQQQQQQCLVNVTTAATMRTSSRKFRSICGNSSGGGGAAATPSETIRNEHNADADADADADGNVEIIEKFLEKINFNINTELILAKRMRMKRAIRHQCRQHTMMPLGNCNNKNNKKKNNNNSKDDVAKEKQILQKKDYYMLYDVWNPGQQYGGQLNISEIGNFTLNDGFKIASWYQRSTTITRRMDMKLARIRCIIVITHKNSTDTLEHYLTTHYDTHLDSMNRFNFALLSYVRDLYNFSFILTQTSTWGYLKNGKFDGMIGALVRKQADIGGSPIFFRIERAKVIDYTTRTWVARPCFIFRHPRNTRNDRIVFLQPFSNSIWIFLAIYGIATISFLCFLTSLERKYDNQKDISIVQSNQKEPRQHVDTASSINVGAFVATNAIATQPYSRHIDFSIARYGAQKILTVASRLPQRAENTIGGVNVANQQTHKNQQQQQQQRRQQRHFIHWGNIICGHNSGVPERATEYNDADADAATASQASSPSSPLLPRTYYRLGLFFDSLLFYIGSICQQGLTFSTSLFSGRCIIITSLFFSFAMYQFYSASIVGTLLMEKPKTIRTLRDLIHSSLEIGIEDIVYNRDYFLRTTDPDAIELYAKKVTTVPIDSEHGFLETPPNMSMDALKILQQPPINKSKSYRDILHSHERGAHAKPNEASNWYEPDYGLARIRKGKFAFHVDVATAYKIISDTFNEKEICDLTEIQLFPPQKMVNIVQKGSPLKKMITYGLRRATEIGLMDYQRKIWHSQKPQCVKQIHTDDLRVDMHTFTSALFVLIFGYAVSLLTLSLEIMHHKLWQHFAAVAATTDVADGVAT